MTAFKKRKNDDEPELMNTKANGKYYIRLAGWLEPSKKNNFYFGPEKHWNIGIIEIKPTEKLSKKEKVREKEQEIAAFWQRKTNNKQTKKIIDQYWFGLFQEH